MRTQIASILAVLALFSANPSIAQPADRHESTALQGADFFRFRLGDITVTALSDGTVPQDLHALLRNTTPQQTDQQLSEAFLQNPVEASINAFLFPLGNRLVLVDTGAGELFGRGNGGKLVESLAAAGYRPEQVTDILLTHIHTDHSGGLVRDGERTFPKAILHAGEPDLAFFLDSRNAAASGYDSKYFYEAIETVKPYVEAGKVASFSGRSEILPGLVAEIHSGHTPGSAFYTLTNGREQITFIGDIIHVAAIQFPHPEVTIVYDVSPAEAAITRSKAFAAFADERTLVAAPHLPFPGIGHLRRAEVGYDWVPVEYGNRKDR